MQHSFWTIVITGTLAACASSAVAADSDAVPPVAPPSASPAAAVTPMPAIGTPVPTLDQVMAALSQAYVHHDGTVYGRVTETGVPSTNIEFQLTTLGSHFALAVWDMWWCT